MKRILFLTALAISCLIYSCGKSSVSPNTNNGDNGSSGGNTVITPPADPAPEDIYTDVEGMQFDAVTKMITESGGSNGEGGGIETTYAANGNVSFVILNLSDTTMTIDQTDDAINITFKKNVDPIIQYKIKNADGSTSTYNLHPNGIANSTGTMAINGVNGHGAFKGVTANAAYITNTFHGTSHVAEHLAVIKP